MVLFPNSKINLGLRVVKKRDDGFHDISTVFYPVSWCDALEIIVSEEKEPFLFTHSGLTIAGEFSSNIVFRAWKELSEIKKLPHLQVHLHKHIPMGAGLGGGSSDAAAFITAVNKLLDLKLSDTQLGQVASRLGSDCAFFIRNKPVLAWGKGDEFKPVDVDLSAYYILIVHPAVHSNTADAYKLVKPAEPEKNAAELLALPVSEWRKVIKNDFENSIFAKFPVVQKVKEQLYDSGAVYASMSGSGSAVFGLFTSPPEINFPETYRWHLQKPGSKF